MSNRLFVNSKSLYRNGFPSWFDECMESCEWVRHKGLEIQTEEFLEEYEEIYPVGKPEGDEDDGE